MAVDSDSLTKLLEQFSISVVEDDSLASFASLEEVADLCSYSGASSRRVDVIGMMSFLGGDIRTAAAVIGLNILSGMGTTAVKASRSSSKEQPKGVQRALSVSVKQLQTVIDTTFKRLKMNSTTLSKNSYIAGLASVAAHLVESGHIRYAAGLRAVCHRSSMEQAFKTLEEEIEVWSEKLLARLPLSETSGYRKEGKLDRSLFPHRELSLVACPFTLARSALNCCR